MFLQRKDIREILKVTDQCLWKWQSEGIGPPCIKVGKRWLYPADGLAAWLKQQPQGGEQVTK